jgi:TPM domain/TIR domain
MPRVVISYRRSDSAAIAGRIADQLKARFGEDSVFMDIDNIPLGVDYRVHIRGELLKSEILIVVIGPRWLAPDPDGTRRIHNEADPVRVEIETALREQVPVFPVLVENAAMPTVKDLPESLHGLAFLNAAEVDIGRDFRHHVDRLGHALDSLTGRRRTAAAAPSDATAATPVATAVGAKTVAKAPRGHWPFLLAVPLLGLLAAGVWLWANPDWLSGRSSLPAYKERVTDEIGYLAPATRANLTQRLVDLEAKSGAQVVFALLTDLPEQPAEYARQLSEHWRVGGEHRNGILLTIFPDDSKLAMDVGSAVQRMQSTHIQELIGERIQRRLNAKDVVGGLIQGMDDIVEVLTGDARAWEVRAKSLPAEAPAVIPSARPPTTYRVLPKVAGGVQNLRAGPSTAYNIVVAIPQGSTGITIGACRPPEDGKTTRPWCAASWRGYAGWISSCCIVDEATGLPPAGANDSSLN